MKSEPRFLAFMALLLSAGLWLVSGAATAQSEVPKLTILADSYPPALHFTTDGHAIGPAATRARAFMAFIERDSAIEFRPWVRVLQEVENEPNKLAMPMTRTDERETGYHWILPLYSNQYNLISLAGSGPDKLDRQGIEAGKWKVACGKQTVQCYTLRSLGFPDSSIMEVTGDVLKIPLRLLQAERVDLIVGDDRVFNEIMRVTDLPAVALHTHDQFGLQVVDWLVAPKSMDPETAGRLIKGGEAFAKANPAPGL